MPTYDIAHIREQGVDLIIIPLQASFGSKSRSAQNEVQSYLQECATSAGLAGTVVPVWDASGGRMGFLAPPNWHSFFRSINLTFVSANINRKLTCS
jgi:hypothetical protein